MSLELQNTITAWLTLEKTVSVPHNDGDYKKLVVLLDELIDEVGENETHPLASLMEVIGVLIENYEDKTVKELSLNS